MKSPVKNPASSNVSGSCGLCYKKTDQKEAQKVEQRRYATRIAGIS